MDFCTCSPHNSYELAGSPLLRVPATPQIHVAGGLEGQGALRCSHLRRGPAGGALPGARGAADSGLREAAGPAR